MASERALQNSAKAIETLRTFLTTKVHMAPLEESRPDEAIFRMTVEGPTPTVIARILIPKERLVVHYFFDRTAPPEVRGKVAEFILRVNRALITGSLELSFDSGTVCYKTGIDFTNTELVEQLIRNAMLTGLEDIEWLVMRLWDVIDEDAEPAAAAADAVAPEDIARFET